MEILRDEDGKRNIINGGNIGWKAFGYSKGALPRMQSQAKKQKGSLSIRDIQSGRHTVELLALLKSRRAVL